MKKELKDYLYLYLGCQIQLPVLENPQTNGVLQLTASVLNNLEDFNEWERCKLILHPLSDMTEEEAIELFKMLSLYDLEYCVFDFIEDESSFCINAELDGRVIDAMEVRVSDFPIINMMNNDGSFSQVSNVQDVFRFFLSKHFDLFGLIEAGLAIDKTTLNK